MAVDYIHRLTEVTAAHAGRRIKPTKDAVPADAPTTPKRGKGATRGRIEV